MVTSWRLLVTGSAHRHYKSDGSQTTPTPDQATVALLLDTPRVKKRTLRHFATIAYGLFSLLSLPKVYDLLQFLCAYIGIILLLVFSLRHSSTSVLSSESVGDHSLDFGDKSML